MNGANCRGTSAPSGLAQIRAPGDDDDKGPWTAWDPETLPPCSKWANAYQVPYPYVGANCRGPAKSLA